jgi:hypothetical protein
MIPDIMLDFLLRVPILRGGLRCGGRMKSYEMRWPDAVRTYLLPSDQAARSYAAGITERGVRVELWLDGSKVATVIGTLSILAPRSFEFSRAER